MILGEYGVGEKHRSNRNLNDQKTMKEFVEFWKMHFHIKKGAVKHKQHRVVNHLRKPIVRCKRTIG